MSSKKMRASYGHFDPLVVYKITDAVEILKKSPERNFDQTVDIAISLGVDPRKANHNVRGMVGMPSGLGKTVKVAVICKGDYVDSATKAGADIVGAESVIESIKSGKIEFDVCIATPEVMTLVSQVARILGPRGLMPNPKLGTVTMDVVGAVKAAKNGRVEYKTDKAGIVHAGIGKMSFSNDKILSNIDAFFDAVYKAKPSDVKGRYVKDVYISSTMGPSIKVDLNDLIARTV